MYVFFCYIALIIALYLYSSTYSCVNRYCLLYVTDMAFGGPYNADSLDRYVLVLQDRHRSHLVDTTQVCIFHIINYCFQLLCNVRAGIYLLIFL